MTIKAKKKNPSDATMRNVRAANKRITQLERQVAVLFAEVGFIERRLDYVLGTIRHRGLPRKLATE